MIVEIENIVLIQLSIQIMQKSQVVALNLFVPFTLCETCLRWNFQSYII